MGYFIIEEQLPSMNEYIATMNNNRHNGNRFKGEIEEMIGWYIKQALTAGTLRPFGETPCEISIEWHEATKRRDVDNIQSAQKFIMDALQAQKVIKRDSQRYVRQIYHKIISGKENYVVVRMLPYECN